MLVKKVIFISIIVFLLQIKDLYSVKIISDIEPGVHGDIITASGSWEISFPIGYLSDGTEVKGVSQLKYNSLKNYCLVVFLNFTIYDLFIFNISYHPEEDIKKTSKGSDSDWLSAKYYMPELFSKSEFENQNNPQYYNIDMFVNIKKFKPWGIPFIFRGLCGYMKNTEKISMKKGVQLISDNRWFSDITIPPKGYKMDDLDSTYTFNWNSYKFGFNLEFDIFSLLKLGTTYALLYNKYNGEGFWNLRTYSETRGWSDAFRDEPPSFEHYDASGIGHDINIKLILYLFWRSKIVLGYSYTIQDADNGKAKYYYYNSSINYLAEKIKVENVHFKKNMFFISLSFVF